MTAPASSTPGGKGGAHEERGRLVQKTARLIEDVRFPPTSPRRYQVFVELDFVIAFLTGVRHELAPELDQILDKMGRELREHCAQAIGGDTFKPEKEQ